MHKLLQRQLSRWIAGPCPTPEEWAQFIHAVDQAYEQADADRALLERSLELSSQELTQINQDLRQDMANKERIQKAMLQSEKLAAIGQLAGGVAHEINNPLGVILGFSQAMARRTQVGDPLEVPVKSIEREALRCKNLVQDLLTFSRVSKTEREPMDLNRAIEGALSLVMAQAKVKNITVQRVFASGLPQMLGNPTQMQQVVVNLANNAFDAMGEKGTLTVKTEALQEGPLSWVLLRVTDTGPGIPPDILPKIFDPFFTTKPVGKGTGLGLSLIQEIVQKHSGTIEVDSKPGCTEFRIKFPIRLTIPSKTVAQAIVR